MEYNTSEVPDYVLPAPEKLEHARSALCKILPTDGLGTDRLKQHLDNDICPGLNQASQSSRYYGFVIGGATPSAKYADNMVTEYDQNVHVHLPNDTICTDVEHSALNMLCELLDLSPAEWTHKTFPTGATAANIIGLACGREHIIAEAGKKLGVNSSVAELGLLQAMRAADLDDIQILTTVPHSSIRKAASVIGLGHASVQDVGQPGDNRHRFDHSLLSRALQRPRTASIIMVSSAEVNTGLFATNGLSEFTQLRQLADTHNAWIHVDAAFGLLCRILPPTPEFSSLRRSVEGLELADSITGDAHKLFNVPYDTGILLSRHLATATQVFQNPGAPYLTTSISSSSNGPVIPSPLMIGLENSRRFRALPVYANLVAYGRSGVTEMLVRQIRLSRQIASFLISHDGYEVLPASLVAGEDALQSIFIIVLFRAKNETVNQELVKRINSSRRIYVSGTSWDGKPACRFAVSNWKADSGRDWDVIREVLEGVFVDA